jgi:hypothetical protein
MDMNIFEFATKNKLRFPSAKGDLTVEQLWELKLQSAGRDDLDTIAKGINAQLKATAEESFVTTTPSKANATLTLKLEILKHIIAVKKQEEADKLNKAAKDVKRRTLTELLGRKNAEKDEQMTPEQIMKELEKLDD